MGNPAMEFAKVLKDGASPINAGVQTQPGNDLGNPYVYNAIGSGTGVGKKLKPGEKPPAKLSPKDVSMAVLGQAPGQTFPTIRGIAGSPDLPPVYAAPGNPVPFASKHDGRGTGKSTVEKSNPHHHPESGQFIKAPTAGAPNHNQRTKAMFTALTSRKQFNQTQQTLAPVIKKDSLPVQSIARQSRLDNPAVYKSNPTGINQYTSGGSSTTVNGAPIQNVSAEGHKALTAAGYTHMPQSESSADGMNKSVIGGDFHFKQGGKVGVYQNANESVLTHGDAASILAAAGVKKADTTDGTGDSQTQSAQGAYDSAADQAYAATSGANDASAKCFQNTWDTSNHSFADKAHQIAADAHKAAAKAAGKNNDSKAKENHLGKAAYHMTASNLHSVAYNGQRPNDGDVVAAKADGGGGGNDTVGGKSSTLTTAANAASAKANKSGLQEDHQDAVNKHLTAAQADPTMAMYHNSQAVYHQSCCDNNDDQDPLTSKADPVAKALQSIAKLKV